MVDMRDIEADPIVMFQNKYYYIMFLIVNMMMPTVVPYYFWGESLLTAFSTAFCLRYLFISHVGWTIGSFAHYFGDRPYDRRIGPTESNKFMNAISFGEGSHNYHHTFPRDYRCSEINMFIFNSAAKIIELLASLRLAHDLQFYTDEQIRKRIGRTGIEELRTPTIHTEYKKYE